MSEVNEISPEHPDELSFEEKTALEEEIKRLSPEVARLSSKLAALKAKLERYENIWRGKPDNEE